MADATAGAGTHCGLPPDADGGPSTQCQQSAPRGSRGTALPPHPPHPVCLDFREKMNLTEPCAFKISVPPPPPTLSTLPPPEPPQPVRPNSRKKFLPHPSLCFCLLSCRRTCHAPSAWHCTFFNQGMLQRLPAWYKELVHSHQCNFTFDSTLAAVTEEWPSQEGNVRSGGVLRRSCRSWMNGCRG